jgi:hypothetical protein
MEEVVFPIITNISEMVSLLFPAVCSRNRYYTRGTYQMHIQRQFEQVHDILGTNRKLQETDEMLRCSWS